jgi:sulfate transport system permease protein
MSHASSPSSLTPPAVTAALVAVCVAFVGLFLLVPLVAVGAYALAAGPGAWLSSLLSPDALAALRLTLIVAALVLPVNVVFGVAAAWLLSRYRFVGKGLLLTLCDVPFSVSPVVAGLMFVLLFGRGGYLAPVLERLDVTIIFALPGIVLTTLFVTLPFVLREVLPVMQAQGLAEEEAAWTLGASSWRTFWSVTLPKIRVALLYGVVLSNARALGEFGAVSVVSGHIRGVTSTLPLQAEIFYNEYNFTGAWAVASLLAGLSLLSLLAKKLLERRLQRGSRPAPDRGEA